MVHKENAIRRLKQIRPKHGPRYTYVFKCLNHTCDKEINVRNDALKTHSGYCLSHSHIKKPYESLYNTLKNDWRKIENTLTYGEFVEFTKITNCNYCKIDINWNPYSKSRAYYLDRKDNNKGYFKENCVVCCTECNKIKGNRFNYNEFMMLAPILTQIRINRQKT